MEHKIIDINTIVVDDITYIAVEQFGCTNCELRRQPECLKVTCSLSARPDHRSVIWKRKTTDIQNKSSSEHTKSMNIEIVNENKIIIDGVKYQSTNVVNGCAGCAFRSAICRECDKIIPCIGMERKDGKSVIWKKVTDKQIQASLSEIRQTKTYKLNFKP